MYQLPSKKLNILPDAFDWQRKGQIKANKKKIIKIFPNNWTNNWTNNLNNNIKKKQFEQTHQSQHKYKTKWFIDIKNKMFYNNNNKMFYNNNKWNNNSNQIQEIKNMPYDEEN